MIKKPSILLSIQFILLMLRPQVSHCGVYPFELKLMILGLKEYPLSQKEETKVKKLIQNIDINSSNIDTSLLNVAIKAEMAQSLILYFNHNKGKRKSIEIDSSSILKIGQKLISNHHQYYTFSRFIIESISSDLWNVLKKPQTKAEAVKFNNIKRYLMPIMEKIITLSPKEFNHFLLPFIKKVIIKISSNLNLYKKFSRTTPLGKEKGLNLTKIFSIQIDDTSNDTELKRLTTSEYQKMKAQHLMEKITLFDATEATVLENKYYWVPQSDLPKSMEVAPQKRTQDKSSKVEALQWKSWSK